MHFPSLLFSSLGLVSHGALAAPSASTVQACKEIANALPKRLSYPLSLQYGSETSEYWSTLLRSIKPACIVLPEYAEEVAAAVKILNKYPDVKFTAKSGGHSPNAGHATVKDGVLIALRNIAGTTYDPDTNLAYVKPGGEWNDVISVLDKHGVTLVGGRLGALRSFHSPRTC
jgi:FAD/FMN-containing dehydrogenase